MIYCQPVFSVRTLDNLPTILAACIVYKGLLGDLRG